MKGNLDTVDAALLWCRDFALGNDFDGDEEMVQKCDDAAGELAEYRRRVAAIIRDAERLRAWALNHYRNDRAAKVIIVSLTESLARVEEGDTE